MTKLVVMAIAIIFTLSATPPMLYFYKTIITLERNSLKADCICLETRRFMKHSGIPSQQPNAQVKSSARTIPRSTQINALDVCHPRTNDNLIMIFVETAPSNVDKRHKIRNTWGSVKRHNEINIRTLFFIGAVENTTLQNMIAAEAATHRDIVQDTSYIDAYRNLTRKTLSAMRWIRAHCPRLLYAFKVDDDTLVNPYNVVAFLTSASKETLDKLICKIGYGARPFRDAKSKWYVSYDDYNGTAFPTYCQGMGYMIPPLLIGKLLEATAAVKLLPTEDVYVTGLLREYIGESHYGLDDTQADFSGDSIGAFIKHEPHVKTMIFLGNSKQQLQYDIFWQLVLESRQ